MAVIHSVAAFLVCLQFAAPTLGGKLVVRHGVSFVVPDNSDHVFLYQTDNGQAPQEDVFAQLLRNTTTASDIFYAVMGDPQFWFHCTPTSPCESKIPCSDGDTGCTKRQNEWANDVQRSSLLALKDLLGTVQGNAGALNGLIINGDVTDYGHDEQLDRLNAVWTNNLPGIKIYPGLGNHDYDNNVDDCTLNHCAHRMLKWYRSYITQRVGVSLDLSVESKLLVYDTYRGSLAYSWDECSATTGTCFHFVQLNNYPTYSVEVQRPLAEWHISSSLPWLQRDLDRNAGKPTLINFHDFDTSFTDEDKQRFQDVIRNYNVLGVFFAHYHVQVGLWGYWCLNGRPVPLVYSGSVPADNYILLQLDPVGKGIKNMYHLQVTDENHTVAKRITLQTVC